MRCFNLQRQGRGADPAGPGGSTVEKGTNWPAPAQRLTAAVGARPSRGCAGRAGGHLDRAGKVFVGPHNAPKPLL